MLFNSFGFLLFFPCVFLLYYALPFRFRKFLLLASSWYFYMCWKPEFIVLILFSTAVDYFCGLGIGRWRQRRGIFLAISLVMNLGLLFFFKYFNFFGQTLTALCRAVSIPWSVPVLDIILPVGISFYTFRPSATPSTSTGESWLRSGISSRSPCLSPISPSWWPGPSSGRKTSCPS